MKIYLVGGAVRDHLLGRAVKERDWVVVGATLEEMTAQGFHPVGKEFPVFLHPITHEEYALARTERKVAKGYKGFEFYTDPNITLEEDLKRRDLTVNAMAQTDDGHIIDPYNGQEDLRDKVLRHVSSAFSEDPVRILRVARFAARFPDFLVHPDTLELMSRMVEAGEVDALVPERVWQELERALQEPQPDRFFEVLDSCGALEILFPEIKAQLQRAIHALHEASKHSHKDTIRFAALFQKVDKDSVIALCKRVSAPHTHRELAVMIAEYHTTFSHLRHLDAKQFLTLLNQTDAFRRPARFRDFLLAAQLSETDRELLIGIEQAASAVLVKPILARGLEGEDIAKALDAERENAIERFLTTY